MNRTDKSAVIERLRASLANVPSVIVADFKGLTVEETDELRTQMRQAGVSYEVVKNTLARRAVADTAKESLGALLRGNSAIAYHVEDPSAPAKVLSTFAKDHKAITIKGGWLDGAALDVVGVEALAKLPGKNELRARFLSVLQGVPTKFVRTLAAGATTFAQVLQARRLQLED